MAVAGEIAVNISARTSKFTTGMKRAGASTRRFRSSVVSSFNPLRRMQSLIIGLAGTAGIYAVVRGFLSAAEAIDKVAKDAARLNITTESVLALNHAAGIYGATSEDITKAITKQQKSVSEANIGLMTQKRAFDQLGLSTEKLSKLNADQSFERIRSAIHGVGNEADQTRIAMDIWGRGGAKLLNLVRASDGDFRKQMRTIRELGVAFDKDGAAKVEAFNDSLLTLKEQFRGEFNKLVIDVAPEATELVRFMQDYIREAAKLIKDSRQSRGRFQLFQNPALSIIQRSAFAREFQERHQRNVETIANLRERGQRLDVARGIPRGLARAGRGILETISGATGINRQNVSKIVEGAEKARNRLLGQTVKELTVGSFQRQKIRFDAERERAAAAAERTQDANERRFQELLSKATRSPVGFQNRGLNRTIESTSVEGIADIRRSRRPNEKLEKINEEQLAELRRLRVILGKPEPVQDIV